MKVHNIGFEKNFKVADYEGEKYIISASLEDGDVVSESFVALKQEVLNAYKATATQVAVKVPTVSTPKSLPAAKTSMPAAKVEPKVETPKAAETKAEPKVETPKATETKAEPKVEVAAKEEPKKEEPKAEPKAKAAPKAKASKNVKYNREMQQHKTDFLSAVAEKFPAWRSTHLEAVKKASISMEGKDMYDGETGAVLDSFKAEIFSSVGGDEVDQI
jgi:hypothetical protein